LLCAKHNQLEAERVYGKKQMERYGKMHMEKHAKQRRNPKLSTVREAPESRDVFHTVNSMQGHAYGITSKMSWLYFAPPQA
jgi:hypothetical protein